MLVIISTLARLACKLQVLRINYLPFLGAPLAESTT